MKDIETISPESFFASKSNSYSTNVGVQSFQIAATSRCLSILSLSSPSLLLDLGSGAGTSMCAAESFNHLTFGVDIVPEMLSSSRQLSLKYNSNNSNNSNNPKIDLQRHISVSDVLESMSLSSPNNTNNTNNTNNNGNNNGKEVKIKEEFRRFLTKSGDEINSDFGVSIPFRDNTFDGAFGIGSIEWLFKSPHRGFDVLGRVKRFFQELIRVVKYGGKVVVLVSPNKHDREKIVEVLLKEASRAGFLPRIVIDYPNSSKKKTVYLSLVSGFDKIKRSYEDRYVDKISEDKKEKWEVKKMDRKARRKEKKEKECEFKKVKGDKGDERDGRGKKSKGIRKSKYKGKFDKEL